VQLAAVDALGRRIATVSNGQLLRIWNVDPLQPLSDSIVHPAVINAVQFSSSGDRLVTSTAAPDSALYLYDGSTGLPLSDPLRPGGAVYGAGFTPAGDAVLARPDLLWRMAPRAATPDPWLIELAEMVAGWRVTTERILTPTTAEQVIDFSGRLASQANPTSQRRWVREFWFGPELQP
jgi:hypothetical protein